MRILLGRHEWPKTTASESGPIPATADDDDHDDDCDKEGRGGRVITPFGIGGATAAAAAAI